MTPAGWSVEACFSMVGCGVHCQLQVKHLENDCNPQAKDGP